MGNVTIPFLILLIFLCSMLFIVNKKYSVVPLIFSMCFLPADTPIIIFSLNFYPIRILGLCGLVKIFFSDDFKKIIFNKIDIIFLSYNLLGFIVYLIASENTAGAFIYKSGQLVDSVIIYIVLRYFIQSKEEVMLSIKIFSISMLLLLPFVIFEFYSSINLFSIFGRDAISTRHGEIRAAATFSHSILFGSFAAAIMSIIWMVYKIEKKFFYLLSSLICIFFVYASSSSGPIVAIAGAIFFLAMYKWRRYGHIFAYFSLFAAIFIHFVRESPIWHFLYLRITIKASSTGQHRYILTEAAVNEFWNWWLLGYGDVGPQWHLKYWPRTHAKFTDVTNHYLLEGVRGGFFTMLLFMVLCYTVIKVLGKVSLLMPDESDRLLCWGFTVMMITHCVSFLSVAYFGQITMLFYFTIAVSSFFYIELTSNKP